MAFEGEAPEGWKTLNLGEICIIKARIGWRGLSAKEYVSDGPFLIAGKHIEDGVIRWDNCDHLTQARYKESPEIMLRAGDVILSKDGTIGVPAFIDQLPSEATINGTMMLLRPDPNVLDGRFLYQTLNGPTFLRFVDERVSGSSIPHIFQRDMVHWRLKLPSLVEQKKIAEILGAVDGAIAKTKAVIEQLDEASGAIIEEKFRDWRDEADMFKIGELATFVGSGVTPKGGKKAYKQAGIPLIRSQNVHFDGIRRAGLVFIDAETDEKMKRTRVRPRDVLLNITGASIGRCTYLPKNFGPANVNQHVCIIRSIQERLLPEFLALFMGSFEGQRQVDLLQGGLSREGLNFQQVRAIELPVPTMAAQKALVETLEDFQLFRRRSQEQLTTYQKLKYGLMAELLSGRRRVPDFIAKTADTKPKPVQPAFKRAVLAAEVVSQLYQDNTFGAVKHEKVVFLSEHHADLHDDIDRHAYKEAAGPYDPKARRSVDANFKKQKWFNVVRDGKRIRYEPLEKQGGHKQYFDRYFSDKADRIQWVIDLMKPLNTQQSEIVATLYAVWNDLLLTDKEPSDDDIVDDVLNNWTDNKKSIPRDRWLSALGWMREKGLVPRGTGEQTRVAAQ